MLSRNLSQNLDREYDKSSFRNFRHRYGVSEAPRMLPKQHVQSPRYPYTQTTEQFNDFDFKDSESRKEDFIDDDDDDVFS